ncbi:MAG: hypothetical protein PHD01_18835, partial [Geobacteraceae bacterium]|nr:hypothetical protein [Geobacteraceae bacterium]
VLALGVRQYLLYHQCQQAMATGDHLLFQFTAIKDHLNESLILREDVNLQTLNNELQNLEKETETLTANILVPDRLKAALPSRVDLVGLEVRLRSIQDQRADKVKETAELARSLNGININLQQFRFHLTDYTQTILLGLHKIIAGALGLIVVLTCTLLFLLNRHLATPILSLCRLTAREEERENEPECSMQTLVERVTDLMSGDQNREGEAGRLQLSTAGDLEREAIRYRHAVTGCIGSELDSELTNNINGVINYTQTLIDSDEQGCDRQQVALLYKSLNKEVKKTAELVATLQRVGQWQSAPASSISLKRLFRMLALVLEKPLRAESIVLSLPTEYSYEVPGAAGDLWLVLLTLLHQGRRALNRALPDKQSEKRLRVECTVSPGEQHRITLALTNSAAAWDDSGTDSIRPSFLFCTHLLHEHGITLTASEASDGVHLILDLPYRNSVS